MNGGEYARRRGVASRPIPIAQRITKCHLMATRPAITCWRSIEPYWKYSDARDCGVVAMSMVFPQCDTACVRAQLDAYHKQAAPDGPGVTGSSPMRTDMRNGIENRRGPISSGQQKSLKELSEHIESTETA